MTPNFLMLPHTRGVEEVGMALRGRQHAGRFAIGFTELAIGGARDQATLPLHRGELRCQCGRGKR